MTVDYSGGQITLPVGAWPHWQVTAIRIGVDRRIDATLCFCRGEDLYIHNFPVDSGFLERMVIGYWRMCWLLQLIKVCLVSDAMYLQQNCSEADYVFTGCSAAVTVVSHSSA